MDKSIQMTLIIAVTILIIFGIGAMMVYNVMPTNLKNTITVSGSSTLDVTPDLVTVYFNVETNGSPAQIAKDENAKIVDDVITDLVKKGFAREDIQTLNFNIYPWQTWENGRTVDRGYKASHQIRIELKENKFSIVGDVIDAGADAGAQISSINFELSQDKQNEYKAQALKEAGEEARIQAESAAEGVGKSIGAVVKLSVDDYNYRPWGIYATASYGGMEDVAMAKEAVTNIAPSTQEVTGTVSVTYKLV